MLLLCSSCHSVDVDANRPSVNTSWSLTLRLSTLRCVVKCTKHMPIGSSVVVAWRTQLLASRCSRERRYLYLVDYQHVCCLQDAVFKIPFPSGPLKYHKFIQASDLKSDEYGVPHARNFAAVDSVVRSKTGDSKSPTICFQMSVKNEDKSGQHGYQQHALVSLRKQLKLTAEQPLFCVLVSPPDMYNTVSFQPLLTKGSKKRVERVDTSLQNMRQFKFCLGWK